MLARPVCAQAASPSFDNSAMDGYAINTACLTGSGPWRLAVSARIAAGCAGSVSVASGTAAQIFTGAPIPTGANAVVMQEVVHRVGQTITVSRNVAPHANIRMAGEDMVQGAVVVPAGRRLTARDIAASAAAGVATVCVRRLVRVALLVTGNEVTAPGDPRASAGIWDVNTSMMRAALAQTATTLVNVQSGKDDINALRQQLAELAAQVDLVVTTGGISVGEEDHVRPALAQIGMDPVFSGVAMKPGKPVSFGRLAGSYWLGLPGNPLSAFVGWQVFGTHVLNALCGGAQLSHNRRRVVLSKPLRHKAGRCELRLAELCGVDSLGRQIVTFDMATHSGRVARLPTADGFIVIPAEAENLAHGALVEFQPFAEY
jgi:molybdopterin molybdotransferase